MNAEQLFLFAIHYLLDIEGGYGSDPDDHGGETKFGISKRAHPDVDIPNLIREGAIEIYLVRYWKEFNCHKLPPAFALALFGAVVNHKGRTAVRLLQHTLRVKSDGDNGPQTQAACRSAAERDPEYYLTDYISRRAMLYTDLAKAPSQKKFLRGWHRRLSLLSIHIGKLLQHEEIQQRIDHLNSQAKSLRDLANHSSGMAAYQQQMREANELTTQAERLSLALEYLTTL